jgi:HK97 family phage major capsid protein
MRNKMSIGRAAVLSAIAAQAAFTSHGAIQRGAFGIRAEAPNVGEAIRVLNESFTQFKAANDQAQAEMKEFGRISSDTQAKVETINADIGKLQKAVDQLSIAMQAGATQAGKNGVKNQKHTDAFNAMFRTGDENAFRAEAASMTWGTPEQGGYLAPNEWDRTITDKLVLISPMRQICRVQATGKKAYTKLFNMHGTDSGWVSETDPRPQTNPSSLKALSWASGEMFAQPAISQDLLDDAEINLEAWLSGEVDIVFAQQEGKAFLSGSGGAQPDGLLTYVEGGSNANKHPFGSIGVTLTGNANAIASDSIIDLVHGLPSVYRKNASFIMNTMTQGAVRKLKDQYGQYLWAPSLVAGTPATIMGFATTEMPDMPDVAAGSLPIVFGDFMQGYLINDRIGIRVLRDPYTAKPYVLFYTTKRVGGGVLNPEVMRALKVATA